MPSTVWHEMQRDSAKSFLPLAGVARRLVAGGVDAVGELLGHVLAEEVVRELLDLLVRELEVRHRRVGVDVARLLEPAAQPLGAGLDRLGGEGRGFGAERLPPAHAVAGEATEALHDRAAARELGRIRDADGGVAAAAARFEVGDREKRWTSVRGRAVGLAFGRRGALAGVAGRAAEAFETGRRVGSPRMEREGARRSLHQGIGDTEVARRAAIDAIVEVRAARSDGWRSVAARTISPAARCGRGRRRARHTCAGRRDTGAARSSPARSQGRSGRRRSSAQRFGVTARAVSF